MSQELMTKLLDVLPYSLNQEEKLNLLLPRLKDLTKRHYESNNIYKNIVDRVFGGLGSIDFNKIDSIPFFPVSLFKTYELRSIPPNEVVKVLTSSGTTGQLVSKVYIDKETAQVQATVLVKIVQHFVGTKRLPMVIIDNKSVLKSRESYSARGAGIMGMSQFGFKPFYALRDNMSIDVPGLLAYIDEFKGNSKILFFGFTFIVWKHFILELEGLGIHLDLRDAILVHSGGWKKLLNISVNADEFRKRIESACGIKKCLNFYGMVEQIGSVYFENDLHYLHAPVYSDVIIRNPTTLKPLPQGEVGLIQVVSALPTSYPGHSLLTEDIGIIRGVDNPDLGMKGKYFEVLGRAPEAELRGCSDTFEEAIGGKKR